MALDSTTRDRIEQIIDLNFNARGRDDVLKYQNELPDRDLSDLADGLVDLYRNPSDYRPRQFSVFLQYTALLGLARVAEMGKLRVDQARTLLDAIRSFDGDEDAVDVPLRILEENYPAVFAEYVAP